jgi:uncharacterized low-complexity protein
MNAKKSALTLAIGSAFAVSMTAVPTAQAENNPFAMQQLQTGYMLAQADTAKDTKAPEGKCGGAKAKDGKCGGAKAKDGKCGEGKCGGAKPKAKDGKCGEGKCGGAKKPDEKK